MLRVRDKQPMSVAKSLGQRIDWGKACFLGRTRLDISPGPEAGRSSLAAPMKVRKETRPLWFNGRFGMT